MDFVNFYQVSLVSDCLDEPIESLVFDYILNHDTGIYYIYESALICRKHLKARKQAAISLQ